MRERTAFPASLLSQLPNLKLLLTTGMRNNGIDLPAATQYGIIVTGAKGERVSGHGDDDDEKYKTYEAPPPTGHTTVIQHSWALLLSLMSRIVEHHNLLQHQQQQDSSSTRSSSPAAAAWQQGTIMTLPGKKLGLVGLGKLGVAFGKIALQSFGMEVVAWSTNLTQQRADEQAVAVGLEKGSFQAVGKEELFGGADVVSLHVVLSERTRGVVGKKELEMMKKRAVLLNTSRGGLIDEQALIETLTAGSIAGFASDVFWEEPLGPESVWRRVGEWSKSSTVFSPRTYMSMGWVEVVISADQCDRYGLCQ